MFRGSIVALVTPFHNGAVDVPRLRELVEFHINAGTHAIVAAGTTGESGTLTYEEKLLVIKTVVDQAKERIPVIAGTAANATAACIELTKKAMECGVHAVLIMTPAYIKPTQEGLFQHYNAIAHAVPVPIILYNVPGRTACDLLPETVARLSHISNIIGIKEATGKEERLNQLLSLCPTVDIYSGDDPTAAEWMLKGAKGVISVTANVVPKQMAKMCDAAMDGNKESCLSINEEIMPLHQLLFVESNPIPVKWAMHRLGLISNEIRLPLTILSDNHQQALEKAMKKLRLL
ncbi:dihydrodipicolinate synthase (plasmid) [Legionella adelaidensis]|uniref:4-hydroxy-tetrahydrodipicolinate synthase n=1 Tax=Legionella adelaidensis TaxID=45056 RepID=A0A0W0R3C5_9GAMM|nr:4-hydroxy-tetrahydrodipicolinate synthase [Legionella adelaidensis]KTC65543.1 dihydrodipicolinate synthase [Legionella adelaidensis]VEH84636.1 dihydrodipicolinate synthase [Legionella adelaidensis]